MSDWTIPKLFWPNNIRSESVMWGWQLTEGELGTGDGAMRQWSNGVLEWRTGGDDSEVSTRRHIWRHHASNHHQSVFTGKHNLRIISLLPQLYNYAVMEWNGKKICLCQRLREVGLKKKLNSFLHKTSIFSRFFSIASNRKAMASFTKNREIN